MYLKNRLTRGFFIVSLIIVLFGISYVIFNRLNFNIVQVSVKKTKESIIEKTKDNEDILNRVAKYIYSQSAPIYITCENGNIFFKRNRNVEEIDESMKDELMLVFNEVNCREIALKEEIYGKNIKILFNDDDIEGYYILIYCEEKPNMFYNEILPNWYLIKRFYE